MNRMKYYLMVFGIWLFAAISFAILHNRLLRIQSGSGDNRMLIIIIDSTFVLLSIYALYLLKKRQKMEIRHSENIRRSDDDIHSGNTEHEFILPNFFDYRKWIAWQLFIFVFMLIIMISKDADASQTIPKTILLCFFTLYSLYIINAIYQLRLFAAVKVVFRQPEIIFILNGAREYRYKLTEIAIIDIDRMGDFSVVPIVIKMKDGRKVRVKPVDYKELIKLIKRAYPQVVISKRAENYNS